MAGVNRDGHLPLGQDKKAKRPGRMRGPGRGGESAVLDKPAQPAAVPGGAPARWGVIDSCRSIALLDPPCGPTACDQRSAVRPRGAIDRLDIGARLRVGGGWVDGWMQVRTGVIERLRWQHRSGSAVSCAAQAYAYDKEKIILRKTFDLGIGFVPGLDPGFVPRPAAQPRIRACV